MTAVDLGPAYVTERPPESMISPVWDGAQWHDDSAPGAPEAAPEGASPPTAEERLYALETAMLDVGELLAGLLGGEA